MPFPYNIILGKQTCYLKLGDGNAVSLQYYFGSADLLPEIRTLKRAHLSVNLSLKALVSLAFSQV